MHFSRTLRLGFSVLSVALISACSSGFKLSRFTSNESLFSAGVREYNNRKWDHAVTVFEKLTFDLPARDTLLPLSHWYLAKSHAGRKEHLLSAQAYNRLAESFATDTLADDAMYEAAREYQQLWRRPTLDAQYGEQALAAYQTLLGLYPDTDRQADANKQIGVLQEWFASKDYESGMYYYRRKAYESALIYFSDVVKNYPQTETAKQTYLRMVTAYDLIRYREDKREVCATLAAKYPGDQEVIDACGPPPPAVIPTTAPDTTVRRDSI